jgi:hypothetical protein
MTDRNEVADAAEDMRKAAHALGCHDDEPFGIFTTKLADLLKAFEKLLHTTKGLPLDKIEGVMRRAAAAGLGDAAKAFRRRQDWRALSAVGAALAVAVGVGVAMGYAAGWEARDDAATAAAVQLQAAFRSGVSGGAWLSEVATNNNLAALAHQCETSSYQSAGGVACSVRLWRRQPEAPP